MRKRGALKALWKHPDPMRLLFGQAVSQLGDGVGLVALTLLVLDTTHSPSKLAWTAAARVTPQVVFLLIGGAIVDRFSRRILLLISDFARGLLTAGLVLVLLTHTLHFWELVVYSLTFGVFDALFFPAMSALIPEIVPEDLLPAMNSLRPLSNNLMGQMIGPAIGGLLVAFSTTWAIGLDCLTFFVSAGALALMRTTPRPTSSHTPNMWREIREGLRYVRSTTWLWTTLAAVTLTNAFVISPMGVLIPYFLRHHLHEGKAVVGYAFAVSGLSGSVGALISANLSSPRRRVRMMWIYWSISTLAGLIMAVATNLWLVLLFPLITSPLILFGNVIWESMMQSEVPRELLGRTSSIDWFVSLGMMPVGLVVAGALAKTLSVGTYYLVASLVSAVPGIAILLSRRANAIDASRLSQNPAAAHRETTAP